MIRAVLLWTLLTAPLASRGQTPAAPSAAASDAPRQAPHELLERADAAYRRRDEPGALEEVRSSLEAARQAAPDDYEVLWRLARLCFWLSDDPAIASKERSRIGKEGWGHGERAIQADPGRVEGWNFAAAGMGNYALGLGIFQALHEGIEAKLKDRLSHAERIDPGYEGGAIPTAWGRFYFKLPWPKYDARRSEKALRAALERNPDNVRARVYLAELYRKEGHGREAADQLEKALAAPPGRYDAPEERRWQGVARGIIDHQ